MRVAVIAPPWVPVPPQGYGGTELVLDTLCRELVRQGHDVLLCATADSRCPVERRWTYGEALGIAAIAPGPELRHALDAHEAIRSWGADIVHDHTLSGPHLAVGREGPPVITTNHGPFDGDLAALYRRLADRVPVLAISHHQAATAGDIPIAAVIHHGIDVAGVPIGSGAAGHVLFLGRMSPDKGVHVAIEVARGAGVPLKIAAKMSEKDEREYFDACVRPLLGGGDVEYLGEVGGSAKRALLADALCLLNPIRWPEPFGMVMVEALAVGTPVLATPCGAAPEIVDDGVTGFLRSDVASLTA
ncbi:MAG TPA: glycosyltransferase, partial [Acidimicrobiales bacterium]|nr:glycosyltransferase [Acidimicrobiales bacterium]